MIPRIFDGQPCIIVAGGPSLSGFDFGLLIGRNVIAINRAYEVLPGAQVLWWTDSAFFVRHQAALEAHPAPFKASARYDYPADLQPAWVHFYRFTGHLGFDFDPGCLRHGNNSAYAAMHLAAHLGASALILLGVDMGVAQKGPTHFHGGHGLMLQDKTLKEVMLPHFKSLAPPLVQMGIQVLNASPDSALRVWPRCSIQQGLAAYDRLAGKGAAGEVSSRLIGTGND